jgi:hypothetical protein
MSGQPYPIGVQGQPWGAAELSQWRARQRMRLRSYADEVLARRSSVCVIASTSNSYGERWSYAPDECLSAAGLPQPALAHDGACPPMLVTGGVHGYETSGVQGALRFRGATMPKPTRAWPTCWWCTVRQSLGL